MRYQGVGKLKLIERPIYNIKMVDYKAIFFVIFIMSIMFSFILSMDQLYTIKTAIGYLFSPEFHSLVPDRSSILESEPMMTSIENRLYGLLNIGKVIVWISTLSWIVYFLFKKPKLDNE